MSRYCSCPVCRHANKENIHGAIGTTEFGWYLKGVIEGIKSTIDEMKRTQDICDSLDDLDWRETLLADVVKELKEKSMPVDPAFLEPEHFRLEKMRTKGGNQ